MTTNVDPTWAARTRRAVKTVAFEIVVELGSHDSEASKRLLDAIAEVVQTKAAVIFPASEAPKGCQGCGEGKV